MLGYVFQPVVESKVEVGAGRLGLGVVESGKHQTRPLCAVESVRTLTQPVGEGKLGLRLSGVVKSVKYETRQVCSVEVPVVFLDHLVQLAFFYFGFLNQ